MPALRGIEARVVTQSQIGNLPEFPHPDGLSYQLQPDTLSVDYASHEQTMVEATQPTGHIPKTNSTVSVYVPSLPGAQFSISYAVHHVPPSSSHIFFKLYMNGRHITSWGVNPKNKSSGCVDRALYEPSERWDQEQDGIVFKERGIEARNFFFIDRQQLSIAEDGGLIEVQAFRARGRKRKAAKLDRYRLQDRYGVTAPSGGLLNNPQDVTFFDFHLLDPKDAPFATFQFHYRSWENLQQLNLIPAEDVSIAKSPYIGPANQDSIIRHAPDDSTIMEHENNTSLQTVLLDDHFDDSVFDDNFTASSHSPAGSSRVLPRPSSALVLRAKPQLRPRSAISQTFPEPSKTLRDNLAAGFPELYVRRPLPDRPLPELPHVGPSDLCASLARRSSTASAAASVAPSLMSYVKNESYLNETVVYGQAEEVSMQRPRRGDGPNEEETVPVVEDSVAVSDVSISDYEGSSIGPIEADEYNSALRSPSNYVACTGSILEEQLSLFDRLKESPTPRGRTAEQELAMGNSPRSQYMTQKEVRGPLGIDLSKFPHLQLMQESPQEARSLQIKPPQVLSPGLGRIWRTLRRKKSRSPLRSLEGNSVSTNYTSPRSGHGEVKERHPYWT